MADWPCFSKFYITFPLDQLPSGAQVVSASLVLHQMGGSGTASNGQPPPSTLVQVMVEDEPWSPSALTWNSAPLASENVARAWVDPVVGCGAPSGIAWPCVPRTWDVSRAVAEAHAAGHPLRLVLYSADSDYSTGKYFTTADTGDWNASGRPTLVVQVAAP
jgi:hypothetical protein